MPTDPNHRPPTRSSRTSRRSSTDPAPRGRPRSRRPRRTATLVALALGSASLVALGSPTAGADEPYLPQDVGLFYESVGCELHLGALAEIKIGAEVHVTIAGDDPVTYEETFLVDNSGTGIFDETLAWGDDVMAGTSGGHHLAMVLTYEGVLIDDFAAPILSAVGCATLAPLAVTIDATGAVPAGAALQVEVRTGECGNTQTPAAVITGVPGETVTLSAVPGASCPSPVDPLGAVISYEPDQQTQVEELVGANVTVVYGFPDAPPPTTTTAPTPSTTAAPTTPAPVVGPTPPTPVTVAPGVARPADLRPATATPVVASPSFTG